MTTRHYLFLAAALTVATPAAMAQESDEDFNIEEYMATDSIVGASGEAAEIGGGSGAWIDVPTDMTLIGHYDTRRLLELYWGNSTDSLVLGALVPTADTLLPQATVAYIIYYDAAGYVSDDDAADINADNLMEEMRLNATALNDTLVPLGYPKQEIVEWAKEPEYDKERKMLRWARHLRFSAHDDETGEDYVNEVVNYDVRILGRRGYVEIKAIASLDDAAKAISTGDRLSESVHFEKGLRYEDYDADTDATSEWGLGGLVAGTVLAKTGILGKIGLFLLKAWKIIAVAAVGIGAAVAKVLSRRKKKEEERKESDK